MKSKRKSRYDLLTQPGYWVNAQWAVTGYGIEETTGRYTIEADRLGESYARELPGWPMHVWEKEWCEPVDFLNAYCMALGVHAGRYKQRFKVDWYGWAWRACAAWVEEKARRAEEYERKIAENGGSLVFEPWCPGKPIRPSPNSTR